MRCGGLPRDEVAPLVRRMDEEQQMDAALIEKLFALGLMGIEIPEEYGGSGGTFFDAVLAVELLSAVDPAVALRGGCAEYAGGERVAALGQRRAEEEVSSAAGGGYRGRVRAERGRIGLGCFRFANARGEARRRLSC